MKLISILLEQDDFSSSDQEKYKIPLETYGDLRRLLNKVNRDKKLTAFIEKGKEVAIDQILGWIPGASNVKSGYDLLKGFINKPDTKKTNTWLDKLDIDDDMSKIVDDTVENGFVDAMFKVISDKPKDMPLEDDFNMNDEMAKYLQKQYNKRTVVGYKKNA